MAHYCINPLAGRCTWRFTGFAIGTDNKALCNCYSQEKPCQTEDVIDMNCTEDMRYIPMEFPKHGDVKEEDFIRFFGKTRAEALQPLMQLDETILKQKLFKDASNLTRRALHDIYIKTDYYTIPLNYINNNYFTIIKDNADHYAKNFIIKSCQKLFPNPKGIKILDYGCGPAIYGLSLALLGYDITLADLPHETFKFFNYICTKYKIRVRFQTCTTNYFDLKGEYDYIICSDVLEHVDEPEELLRVLINKLKFNGVLFLATFFDDMDGQDPSHLKKNTKKYKHYQEWLGRVTQMGIVPIISDDNGVEKCYFKKEFIEKILKNGK